MGLRMSEMPKRPIFKILPAISDLRPWLVVVFDKVTSERIELSLPKRFSGRSGVLDLGYPDW